MKYQIPKYEWLKKGSAKFQKKGEELEKNRYQISKIWNQNMI